MFNHQFLPKLHIERSVVNGKRHYVTPDGVFPSVTTILSDMTDQSSLQAWKEREGANAEKISTKARHRGTALHAITEKYVLNDLLYKKGSMPSTLFEFNQIKPVLDANVELVYGVELPLYSTRLMAAGTADQVIKWNGKNSILDLKTSRRNKSRESIENYFVQGAFYGIMVEEIYDMPIEQVVILIMVDDNEPQTFIVSLDEYREKVEAISKGYYHHVQKIFNNPGSIFIDPVFG